MEHGSASSCLTRTPKVLHHFTLLLPCSAIGRSPWTALRRGRFPRNIICAARGASNTSSCRQCVSCVFALMQGLLSLMHALVGIALVFPSSIALCRLYLVAWLGVRQLGVEENTDIDRMCSFDSSYLVALACTPRRGVSCRHLRPQVSPDFMDDERPLPRPCSHTLSFT